MIHYTLAKLDTRKKGYNFKERKKLEVRIKAGAGKAHSTKTMQADT